MEKQPVPLDIFELIEQAAKRIQLPHIITVQDVMKMHNCSERTAKGYIKRVREALEKTDKTFDDERFVTLEQYKRHFGLF